MNYTLRIRPEAEADLAEAKRWYDQQREGLGDDLVLCVEEALDRIQRMPGIHAPVYKDARRALVRRFPYVIYYHVDGDQVAVLAIVHGRRSPRFWQARAD